jgi:hypothetical protein
MADLFCTYTQCGQFKEAEELGGGGGETEGDLWRKPLSHPVDHESVGPHYIYIQLGKLKKSKAWDSGCGDAETDLGRGLSRLCRLLAMWRRLAVN